MKKLFGLVFLALAFLTPELAHAASRFWVGGTGTWDASDTTHWSATDGGAGGASVPGSSDTVSLNANSGGGTVTVNFGGTITIISLDCAGFTGTLDFATNDNNVTLSASGNAFIGGSTATKTVNMGDGTWTLSGTNNTFTLSGANANLTFNANGSTIAFNGSGAKTLIGGGKTFNNITVAASSNTGYFATSNSTSTIGSLTIAAPNSFVVGTTPTITTLAVSGTSSTSTINVVSNSPTIGNSSLPVTNNFTGSWMNYSFITFSGGTHTSSNSFGNNYSGITVSAPSGGGSNNGRIIGG